MWTFSGIRPLYDDGASDPSSITRDYVFKLDRGEGGGAAALSIYGGKITTYRKLAEHALAELAPFVAPMKPRWTEHAVLPGGDLPAGGLGRLARRACAALPGAAGRNRATASRGGTARARSRSSATAKSPADLGEDFGHGLTAAEIDYLVRAEWARTGDDVLWRRTKCGLGMTDAERARVARVRGESRRGRAGVSERSAMQPLDRRCRSPRGARFAAC